MFTASGSVPESVETVKGPTSEVETDNPPGRCAPDTAPSFPNPNVGQNVYCFSTRGKVAVTSLGKTVRSPRVATVPRGTGMIHAASSALPSRTITMSIVSVLPSQVIRDVSAPTAAPELEMRAPQAQAAAGRGTSTRADASRSEHAAIRTSLMHGTVRRWEGQLGPIGTTVRSQIWDGYVHDPVDRANLASSSDAHL